MSLQIVSHLLFVLLVGLGVFANSGPQAGGNYANGLGIFLYCETSDEHRLMSLRHWGHHVFFIGRVECLGASWAEGRADN